MSDYEMIKESPYTVRPSMAVCSECGGQLRLTVWSEGIDSSIKCEDCGEEDIYR
jgi:predicted RNA-binding Zn-ribbon protein involved in translation (DUF1610 family)